MLKPRIDNWDEDEELNGLLLFAQLIDEMLFDYTIDTYKPPVLNTHSLCEELLDAIDEVKEGFLKEKSIEPIKEELVWSLQNDPAAKSVLGYRYNIILNYLRSSNNFNELSSNVAPLKNLLDLIYIDEIKKELKELVETPTDKEKITTLSKILISELLSNGYSQQYIFFETRKYFFQTQRIYSPHQIDEYLSKFSFKTEKWDVLFKGDPDFKHAKELKLDIEIEITEEKPEPRTTYPKEIEYLNETDKYPIFIIFKNMEALDPFHAREIAEEYLNIIDNLASYNIHKERLNWDKDSLVYLASKFTIVEPPVSPMAKIRDSDITELSTIIEKRTTFFEPLDAASTYCIFNSFDFHSSSIQTKSSENQLMNLWTAMESLLPPPQEQRILHFINSFEPLLSRKYVQKLIKDLLNNLRLNYPSELNIILSKLPPEFTDIEKVAALISIKDENEKLRDELYTSLGRNPLLINRIYTLMKNLHSADNIYTTIELHRNRIRWHLQRIYRARNLITHKGEEIIYVNQLVENLHSYYHTIIDLIQEISTQNKNIDSLETVFNLIRIEYEAHIALLKDSKEEKCNNNNFKLLIFNM